ncbi:transglutaminase domain-containing protein [Granulosicoccaceae sp. 1_MG-2023]|nr:transglutaminase domain-containing protein [Granulosicoccaceae sp. 1_MG-2023]
MSRRDFLKQTALLTGSALLPSFARAADSASGDALSAPGTDWRTFEVTHQLNIPQSDAGIKAWFPLPSLHEAAWMRPMGDLWETNADDAYVVTDPVYGARMLYAQWQAGAAPELTILSRFAGRDRSTDFSAATPARLSKQERALYTNPTRLLPTGGIVGKTAREITRGLDGDKAKAEAIYQWIVENTFRDPETRGCGLGDISYMLETGDLGGKCADLNALFVGLARAAGLPARDVYGIRVTESRLGFQCLGKSGDISKGQHCRSEVFLEDYGWVAVDPADVRKVALEEPPGELSLDAPEVVKARELLFGGWETNWLAYNVAHDIDLPGSEGPELAFLMYPQVEVGGKRLDSLNPQEGGYQIYSKEITA